MSASPAMMDAARAAEFALTSIVMLSSDIDKRTKGQLGQIIAMLTKAIEAEEARQAASYDDRNEG